MNDMNTLQHPWIVGLTGGIVSGKSTVADGFAALGAFVVDAEALTAQIATLHSVFVTNAGNTVRSLVARIAEVA